MNAPRSLAVMWKLFAPLLPPRVRAKAAIYAPGDTAALFRDVAGPEHIPECVGGTATNEHIAPCQAAPHGVAREMCIAPP